MAKRAITLSEALSLGRASETDDTCYKTRDMFRSDVNLVGNRCPVLLPGMEYGRSFRARNYACSVTFGKRIESCGIIGAPSVGSAIEAIQTACVERIKHETRLPKMMLAIGGMQCQSFKTQNTVSKNESTRAFAVSRGKVEGVAPISKFPGWYQPENGEVYNGGKRQVPALLFDHVRITLGAKNDGRNSEKETEQSEDSLVPIGASISEWKNASDEQKEEWRSGIYTSKLKAKSRKMKRIKSRHLWKMVFQRTIQGQKNTIGGMRKCAIHTDKHVGNPTSGMMTIFGEI
jgi:hypothetical protein